MRPRRLLFAIFAARLSGNSPLSAMAPVRAGRDAPQLGGNMRRYAVLAGKLRHLRGGVFEKTEYLQAVGHSSLFGPSSVAIRDEDERRVCSE